MTVTVETDPVVEAPSELVAPVDRVLGHLGARVSGLRGRTTLVLKVERTITDFGGPDEYGSAIVKAILDDRDARAATDGIEEITFG